MIKGRSERLQQLASQGPLTSNSEQANRQANRKDELPLKCLLGDNPSANEASPAAEESYGVLLDVDEDDVEVESCGSGGNANGEAYSLSSLTDLYNR